MERLTFRDGAESATACSAAKHVGGVEGRTGVFVLVLITGIASGQRYLDFVPHTSLLISGSHRRFALATSYQTDMAQSAGGAGLIDEEGYRDF